LKKRLELLAATIHKTKRNTAVNSQKFVNPCSRQLQKLTDIFPHFSLPKLPQEMLTEDKVFEIHS